MKKLDITLAITSFNRATQLFNSLRRLEDLTLPSCLLIVDDGSNPKLEPVVNEFKRRFDIPVEYHYLNNPCYDVCSIPRNFAVGQCKTEYFMTSEPEIVFCTDVVKQMSDRMIEDGERVVSTGVVYAMHHSAKSSEDVFLNPSQYLANNPYDERIGWVAPYAALYKTEWLKEIGGWDEDFSLKNGGGGYAWDDTDLLTRLRVNGHGQIIDPDIKVIHQWHEAPPPGVIDGWAINERKFLAKDLQNSLKYVVANVGRSKGKIC